MRIHTKVWRSALPKILPLGALFLASDFPTASKTELPSTTPAITLPARQAARTENNKNSTAVAIQPENLAARIHLFERYSHKLAIVIQGDNLEDRHIRNADNAVDTLMARGFPAANIFVAGKMSKAYAGVNRFPGTPAGTTAAIRKVQSASDNNSLVVIYVTGHGAENSIALENGNEMPHKKFQQLVSKIQGYSVYIVDICFGGRLANLLADSKKSSLSIAPDFEARESSCQFFAVPLWSAIRYGMDLDQDGWTSMREAFTYAMDAYRTSTKHKTTGTFRKPLEQASEKILSLKGPALLKVSIPGCVPCIEQERILSTIDIATEGDIPIFSADAEESEKLLHQLGIMPKAFPTIAYLMDGKVIAVQDGLQNYDRLMEGVLKILA